MLFELNTDSPDAKVYEAVRLKWDGISKPIDGLGDFEKAVCKIAAIQGIKEPSIGKRAAVIMCADNGIVEEGISQTGKEITKAVAAALGNGISTACTMGRASKVDILPVDIGIDCDGAIKGVRDLKISKGTGNFLKGPAMTEEEALLAIERGIDLAGELKEMGYEVVATGEMGIGNTTTSAAVLSTLLHVDSDEIVGRGSGLDDEGVERKKAVVKRGLEMFGYSAKVSSGAENTKDTGIPDERQYAFEVLVNLGGLDIAGLCGLCIGAAGCHLPVVLDGVISTAAALVAERIHPGVRQYLIPSHAGREKGNVMALKALGLAPLIEGNMALGEGTGAIMLFPLLDVVMDYFKNGAGFGDYKIEEYKRFD